jgi:cellulose synthase/poly-beta-1,6-N-acetylglucosamine synthase-like glycosyltransferase
MSTEPLVSVMIPAYRAEATLPAAVRSLLAQTCPSWQAIIASDARCWRASGSAASGGRTFRT